MITKPEYVAGTKDLVVAAKALEAKMSQQLLATKTLIESIKVAQQTAAEYHAGFEDLLSTTLARVGNTAVDHYDDVLGTELTTRQKNQIVKEQILKQDREKYYGATLDQRLTGSRRMNAVRIRKSAHVGKSLDTKKLNLTRIFLHSYPFGAQVLLDQRIMLGQSLKLEHMIGLAVAKKAGVEIVKWSLSERHPKRDICDDYAESVDKAVVKWLKKKDVDISPQGLYFIDDVPEPPHPNCQCYLRMLKDKDLSPTIADRAWKWLKDLLGRLR